MAFIEPDRRSRLPSVAAVVLIHVGIGYAFLSGLAFEVIRRGPDILQLIPLADAPPPPPMERQQPPPRAAQPAARSAVVPDRIVTTPSDPVVIDVQPLPPVLTQRDAGPVIAPPPTEIVAAVRSTAPQAKGDRGRWIGTEDYPAAALRQGDEGSVGIAVRLGSDGRIKACEVTASSGHAALDQATCRLYAARARFAPATEGGQAVATTIRDRITWRLPR